MILIVNKETIDLSIFLTEPYETSSRNELHKVPNETQDKSGSVGYSRWVIGCVAIFAMIAIIALCVPVATLVLLFTRPCGYCTETGKTEPVSAFLNPGRKRTPKKDLENN